ncbi:unnamed protein product, partial [marine sediment metagenome]
MSKRKWQCDICKVIFDSKNEAIECESHHLKIEDLEIVEIKGFGDFGLRDEFPGTIKIRDKKK